MTNKHGETSLARRGFLKGVAASAICYTGNILDGVRGAAGRIFPQHGALCLETQRFPDAVHQPSFPSVILRPGARYRHETRHTFAC